MLTRENTIIELKEDAIKEYSGITFRELPFVTKINIRGNPNDKNFMSANEKIINSILPTKINTYTNNEKIKILWLGPNEWLIVDENENFNSKLISQLDNINNQEEPSVTDVSENRTIIRIAGKNINTLLGKFIVLDLDKNLENESSVVQTLFVKVPIILVRNHGNSNNQIPEIDLYTNRSHANYVYNLLVDGTHNLKF